MESSITGYPAGSISTTGLVEELASLLRNAAQVATTPLTDWALAEVCDRADLVLCTMLLHPDLRRLHSYLKEFFQGLSNGSVPQWHLSYLSSQSQEQMATGLEGARRDSPEMLCLLAILRSGGLSGIPILIRAGQIMQDWLEVDPHLEVVGPALVARRDSIPYTTAGAKAHAAATVRSIDHVLSVLISA